MRQELFLQPRKLRYVNLKSNICINGNFSDMDALSKVITESCENPDPAEVKPVCEVIEKCPVGEKCCRLSKFKSESRLELKEIKHQNSNCSNYVDAISYNSNKNVEYLLIKVNLIFKKLKAYDASNCAVREIFWKNFEWLFQLESINLANNQISSIIEELYSPMQLKNLDLCNFFFYFTVFQHYNVFIFQPTTA